MVSLVADAGNPLYVSYVFILSFFWNLCLFSFIYNIKNLFNNNRQYLCTPFFYSTKNSKKTITGLHAGTNNIPCQYICYREFNTNKSFLFLYLLLDNISF